MSQYSSWPTDGCTSGACRTAFAAPSSLDQGQQFASMTKAFHGGSRKNRKQNRSQRKRMNTRRHRRSMKKQRGGAAAFPDSFTETLPISLRGPADVASLDTAFAQLPQYTGKYGGVGGARRIQYGGALSGAGIAESGSLLLPASMEAEAGMGMNSQFQTENTVNPNFRALPNGPLASQVEAAMANQSRYMAKGGRRKGSRKAGKKSRKGRKGSRKAGKKSRKGRKGSRKAGKKSRKGRKGSRRH